MNGFPVEILDECDVPKPPTITPAAYAYLAEACHRLGVCYPPEVILTTCVGLAHLLEVACVKAYDSALREEHYYWNSVWYILKHVEHTNMVAEAGL